MYNIKLKLIGTILLILLGNSQTQAQSISGIVFEKLNQSVKTYCQKNKIEVLYKIDQLQTAMAFVEEKLEVT